MFPCEIDLSSTTFVNVTIIKYELELPPMGKKICLKLTDDCGFTILYILDTITNSPAVHQLPYQANQNVWIVKNDCE